MKNRVIYNLLFISLIIFLFVFSCKEESHKLGCEKVEYFLERDQYYRKKYANIWTPKLYLLDSLLKIGGYNGGLDELQNIEDDLRTKLRSQVDEIYERRSKPDSLILDSIIQLQTKIDYENTRELIKIINNTNRSSLDTMSFDCSRKSFIVFVHTPNELKEEVRTTIERINLKDIDEYQYNHIMWHLNGRKSR